MRVCDAERGEADVRGDERGGKRGWKRLPNLQARPWRACSARKRDVYLPPLRVRFLNPLWSIVPMPSAEMSAQRMNTSITTIFAQRGTPVTDTEELPKDAVVTFASVLLHVISPTLTDWPGLRPLQSC